MYKLPDMCDILSYGCIEGEKMIKDSYDIVVVGSGPAGTSVAKTCAKHGLDVVVFERNNEVGAPKRCGEGISANALKRLALDIPKRCIAQEIDGAYAYAPNGKDVKIKFESMKGYVLERKVFDKWLAYEAAKAGARIFTKTFVKDLIIEDNFVKGVVIENSDGEKQIRAKIIVAADGVESTIMRKAGIRTNKSPLLVDSGLQYEMAGIDMRDPKMIELFFGNKIAPRGYCLTGESEVITEEGIIPISDITKGEKVHNLLGWTPVSATSVREYDGNVIRVIPFMFNTEVGMTEDHLVYVWNKRNGFTWKKAGDLKKGVRGYHRTGDYLVFPIPVAKQISCINLADYYEGIIEDGMIYPLGRNQFGAVFKYKHGIMQNLPLTMELMELIGYFISEGNTNSNGIIISNTNADIVNRIKNIGLNAFGFKPSVWINENDKPCIQVNFASMILKNFFAKEFGIGCRNKRIPRWVFGLPTELKKSFLIGLFRGDGSKEISTEGYNILNYISTSKQLIYDLWILLTTIGIVGAIGKNKKKNAYRLRIRGSQINELSDIFDILKHGKRGNKGFFIKDSMIMMGIRSMKTEHFSGKVYDIESGGSFCPGFIVHNCWLFPKGANEANVGIGISGAHQEDTAKAYLDRFIESHPELAKGSIIEVNAGSIPVGGLMENMVGNGIIGVGDAVNQVNAIHGGGIPEAITAGNIAGDVIKDAFVKNDFSKETLSAYNKQWWQQRGDHLKNVEKVREMVENMSDDNMNDLAEVLSGEDLTDFAHGKNIMKLIKIAAKYKLKGVARRIGL